MGCIHVVNLVKERLIAKDAKNRKTKFLLTPPVMIVINVVGKNLIWNFIETTPILRHIPSFVNLCTNINRKNWITEYKLQTEATEGSILTFEFVHKKYLLVK